MAILQRMEMYDPGALELCATPSLVTSPASTSISSAAAEAAASTAAARLRQGTPRVMRNCFEAGRYALRLAGSPLSHDHVGHARTFR